MGYLEENQEFNLYKDISQRTGGEIYIGVVGPVRTGKSTFIKRFMDIMVIPKIENEHDRTRAMDDFHRAAVGKPLQRQSLNLYPKKLLRLILMTIPK